MFNHTALRLYRTAAGAVGSALNATRRTRFHTASCVRGTRFFDQQLAHCRPIGAQALFRRHVSEASKTSSESPEPKGEAEEGEHTNQQEEAVEDETVDFAEVAELRGKLAEATDKLKEVQLKYRISLDNCEQLEKISAKKLQNAKLYAITQFARDMLGVADAFELAFKALSSKEDAAVNTEFIEGIRLTEAQLHKTFEKYGVKRFDSLQHAFNPEVHEAMFEIPDESAEKNTVLQVVFNGYMINDRLLRPAKVGVSRK
ncbi:nucleotide exchange factor GrpE [Babesia caballi]|uniref:GrpE protein homolog n=1 Tax=Babesia caballi TaxID=5871 RepID=A0AAV4LSI4_BABCB|nr:nucleotide exchange factor GrpE [Babesia caballi]